MSKKWYNLIVSVDESSSRPVEAEGNAHSNAYSRPAVAKEKERFFARRLKKQEEEQKIGHSVSYFVTENPITGASHARGESG